MARLGSALSVVTANCVDFNVYAGVTLSSFLHQLVSRRSAITSVRLSAVSQQPFRPSLWFPCISRRFFVPFPTPVVVFRLPSADVVIPEGGLTPHGSSTLVFHGLFAVVGWHAPLRMSSLTLVGAWRMSQPLYSLPPVRGLQSDSSLVFSCPQTALSS
jgi:hypothetical protein